jgi:CheY-like chemotaxis protein
MQILFIDDHKASANAFAEIAVTLGQQVQVAYDGKTAIVATQNTPFDVVFFDIGLPDCDGRELCRRVREGGASQHASVIAVTGMEGLHAKELEPFDGFLHKLVSPGDLRRALDFAEG